MVNDEIIVGVPLISPVVGFRVIPVGKAGTTDHETTVPPSNVGVTAVIALSFVNVNEFGLYVSEDGATSLTMMVTVAVSLPPVLPAVMV